MALAVLSSCGSEKGIEGIWKGVFEGQEGVIELSKDGTGKIYMDTELGKFFMGMEWKTEGNKFIVTIQGEESSTEYKLDGDKLTMDGETLTRGTEKDIPKDATDIAALAAAFGSDDE